MFRKSTLVLALGLAITANQAAALGLGALRTQSALNQPFYAELDLLDVKGDELDAVKVRLASSEEFAKAGAERPHYLTRLQFTPMVGPRGEPLVQITSREPIREPYLDFLVEVIWPSGRMVKEFAVLLDPPSSKPGRRPAVTAPQVASARRPPPAPAARPAAPAPAATRPAAPPAPAQPQPAPRPAPVRLPPAPPPRPAPPVAAPAPQPVPAAAAQTSFPLRYGPIPRGGALGRIARRATPPGATVAQTAMAFYRNSQDAFLNGDINQLRIGGELVVPTAAELFALDAETAERQLQEAMAGRAVPAAPMTDPGAQLVIAGAPAVEPPPATAPATAPPQPTAGPATAAVPGSPAGATPPVAVTPPPGAAAEAPTGVAGLTDDLLAMREVSEVNRQETTELRDRIRELEGQLADIHELLTLRNEQLASIQTPPAAPGDGALLTDAERGVATEPVLGPAPGTTAEPGPAAGAQTLPDEGPAEPQPPPDNVVDQESGGGVLRTLTSALPWVLAIGGGGVLLGALGLLLYRRRRPDDGFDDDLDGELNVDLSDLDAELPVKAPDTPRPSVAPPPVLASTPRVPAPPPVEPAARAAAGLPPAPIRPAPLPEAPATPQPPTPAPLEPSPPRVAPAAARPTPPLAAPQHTQEADVQAEADIYILYGRYREAEALLREALEDTPERAELRFKLAEAFIGAGAREPLAALKAEMEGRGEARLDPAKWQEITQALAELDRATPAAPSAPTAPASAPAQPPVEPVREGSAAVPPAPARPVASVQIPSSSVAELTDFDTALGLAPPPAGPVGADPLHSPLDDLDLDLQDLDQIGPLSEDPSLPPPSPQAPARSAPPAPSLALALPEDPSELDNDLDLMDSIANFDATSNAPDLYQPDATTPLMPDSGPAPVTPAFSEPPTLPEPSSEVVSAWGSPDPTPAARRAAAPAPGAPVDEGLFRGDVSTGSDERFDSDGADNMSSDVLSSQWRMDSGLWDEAATKMDLARAYIEMEDPDAARAILEEVIQEGNAEQRTEAKGLLAKIQ